MRARIKTSNGGHEEITDIQKQKASQHEILQNLSISPDTLKTAMHSQPNLPLQLNSSRPTRYYEVSQSYKGSVSQHLQHQPLTASMNLIRGPSGSVQTYNCQHVNVLQNSSLLRSPSVDLSNNQLQSCSLMNRPQTTSGTNCSVDSLYLNPIRAPVRLNNLQSVENSSQTTNVSAQPMVTSRVLTSQIPTINRIQVGVNNFSTPFSNLQASSMPLPQVSNVDSQLSPSSIDSFSVSNQFPQSNSHTNNANKLSAVQQPVFSSRYSATMDSNSQVPQTPRMQVIPFNSFQSIQDGLKQAYNLLPRAPYAQATSTKTTVTPSITQSTSLSNTSRTLPFAASTASENKIATNETGPQMSTLGVTSNLPGITLSKVHLRKAAGIVWSDPSLDDWPKDDFRIFCGDLGNEVTDELLSNAFRFLKSFQRARVIRDKRTGKGKGFGFVSFGDPEDMLRAIKEMDRKYVGNRPIRVMKSKWQDREVESDKNKRPLEIAQPLNSKDMKKFKLIKPVTGGKKAAPTSPSYNMAGSQASLILGYRGRGIYRGHRPTSFSLKN